MSFCFFILLVRPLYKPLKTLTKTAQRPDSIMLREDGCWFQFERLGYGGLSESNWRLFGHQLLFLLQKFGNREKM